MMKSLCFVLFSIIISVQSNPLSQLVQSCSTCQPSYSNPTSIPVVIQQPSNTSPCFQTPTVQLPAGYAGPLGETLNQIVLNKILSNPSLQKIIDPNTRLYNQNGEEVQRQAPKSTGAPNVINNYFIVPPEFFNLNETTRNENEEVIALVDNKAVRKPRRRKLKRKPKIIELSSAEDDSIVTKRPVKRHKKKESGNVKQKRNRVRAEDSSEIIDDIDVPQEIDTRRVQEPASNKRKNRLRKTKKQERPVIPPVEESYDDFQEVEEISPKIRKNKKEKVIESPQKLNTKQKIKIIEEMSDASISDNAKGRIANDDIVIVKEKSTFPPDETKTKKEKRKESSTEQTEQKVLQNIEIPTDIPNRDKSEKRKTRGSKKTETKQEPEQNIAPFSDDVLKNFFPYMPPVGNFYNPNSNHPYNFDHYYQYLNPVRNSNANRNKKRRKNQNRKNNEPNSNTHTIEIKLKPKKKENNTEIVTTEKPKDVSEVLISIEVDQSTESIEQVTNIPMEMPRQVAPVKEFKEDDSEAASKESYVKFSKLEELHEFITPELGEEDVVPAIHNNRIINDYYPVFDDDVYYNPHVETINNLDDDRYFYDTGAEDKPNERKFERYEDAKASKRVNDEKGVKNSDSKPKRTEKNDPDINKFDHNEYLDHIAKFSDTDTIKSSAEMIRVKVPSKNTRVKTEAVETVFAGSKVAKYGVSLDESTEDSSSYAQNSDENSYSGDGQTTYVVAKSLGSHEDYW